MLLAVTMIDEVRFDGLFFAFKLPEGNVWSVMVFDLTFRLWFLVGGYTDSAV